ncbi:PQQ-binding-like beta-propeller repeat protein [Sulfidibacter corallicola]
MHVCRNVALPLLCAVLAVVSLPLAAGEPSGVLASRAVRGTAQPTANAFPSIAESSSYRYFGGSDMLLNEKGDAIFMKSKYVEMVVGGWQSELTLTAIGSDGDVAFERSLGSSVYQGGVALEGDVLVVALNPDLVYIAATGVEPAIDRTIDEKFTIVALNAETGEEIWRTELSGNAWFVSPDQNGGWLVRYSDNQETGFEEHLAKLDGDGNLVWDRVTDVITWGPYEDKGTRR